MHPKWSTKRMQRILKKMVSFFDKIYYFKIILEFLRNFLLIKTTLTIYIPNYVYDEIVVCYIPGNTRYSGAVTIKMCSFLDLSSSSSTLICIPGI